MNTLNKREFSVRLGHHRDLLLQIWLPVGLAILVVAAVATLIVLAATKSSPVVSQASSVSIIFMVMPVMILGIFNVFLMILAIYLVAKLTGKISPVARSIQGFLAVVDHKTSQLMNGATAPFIKVRSIWAAARSIFHQKQ